MHILECKAVFHNVCLNMVWTQVRAIGSLLLEIECL
jgi:hypothetical protein